MQDSGDVYSGFSFRSNGKQVLVKSLGLSGRSWELSQDLSPLKATVAMRVDLPTAWCVVSPLLKYN